MLGFALFVNGMGAGCARLGHATARYVQGRLVMRVTTPTLLQASPAETALERTEAPARPMPAQARKTTKPADPREESAGFAGELATQQESVAPMPDVQDDDVAAASVQVASPSPDTDGGSHSTSSAFANATQLSGTSAMSMNSAALAAAGAATSFELVAPATTVPLEAQFTAASADRVAKPIVATRPSTESAIESAPSVPSVDAQPDKAPRATNTVTSADLSASTPNTAAVTQGTNPAMSMNAALTVAARPALSTAGKTFPELATPVRSAPPARTQSSDNAQRRAAAAAITNARVSSSTVVATADSNSTEQPLVTTALVGTTTAPTTPTAAVAPLDAAPLSRQNVFSAGHDADSTSFVGTGVSTLPESHSSIHGDSSAPRPQGNAISSVSSMAHASLAAMPGVKPVMAAGTLALTEPAALNAQERAEAIAQVRVHLAEARPEVTIILDPPALGEVHVRMSLHQGELHAKITARNSDVANALRQDMHGLRSALQEAGLSVVHVDIRSRDDMSAQQHTRDNSASAQREANPQQQRSEGDRRAATAAQRNAVTERASAVKQKQQEITSGLNLVI